MRIVEGEEEITTGPVSGGDSGTIRGEGWIAGTCGARSDF